MMKCDTLNIGLNIGLLLIVDVRFGKLCVQIDENALIKMAYGSNKRIFILHLFILISELISIYPTAIESAPVTESAPVSTQFAKSMK